MRTINKLILGLCLTVATSLTASAQWCLSNSKEAMIQKDPLLSAEQKSEILEKLPAIIEAERKAAKSELNRNTKADKIIIPVVVHIFHQGGEENLSNEDIVWAIDQMNLDFAQNNPNREEVMTEFQSIIEDSDIEFRLATIDPDGNCTNGITRHRMSNVYFSGQNEIEPLKN